MHFAPTEEHRAFAEAIDDVAERTGSVSAARAWARGDHGPGLAAWRRLAEVGVVGLRVPEEDGGFGGEPADLVVATERLGYHGLPGPYLETIALLSRIGDPQIRAGIAAGEIIATATVPPLAPLAVDADAATDCFIVTEGRARPAEVGPAQASMDPTRRLSELRATGDPLELPTSAVDETTLAAAAWLVGAGERALELAVAYARVRTQFGRAIGEYQAVKHRLADARIALTFARPLVHRAALTLEGPEGPRDVSAAKLAASRAADGAARAALQVHGAIGYTEEHELGLGVLRIRALVGAWGGPDHHRERIARDLARED